ncbi:hypothetical protein BLNAU_14003 [Blattamonas nauphoetae]|uniref:Uncharacterized protein n=1 Tax=Blattamonas nauphoetae TaxID=2049346 RepID=A0ABQ9XKA7_9EUKA|nr:hypothetical protein BLNAU_14003 [Blattamonas nauphoetae]
MDALIRFLALLFVIKPGITSFRVPSHLFHCDLPKRKKSTITSPSQPTGYTSSISSKMILHHASNQSNQNSSYANTHINTIFKLGTATSSETHVSLGYLRLFMSVQTGIHVAIQQKRLYP